MASTKGSPTRSPPMEYRMDSQYVHSQPAESQYLSSGPVMESHFSHSISLKESDFAPSRDIAAQTYIDQRIAEKENSSEPYRVSRKREFRLSENYQSSFGRGSPEYNYEEELERDRAFRANLHRIQNTILPPDTQMPEIRFSEASPPRIQAMTPVLSPKANSRSISPLTRTMYEPVRQARLKSRSPIRNRSSSVNKSGAKYQHMRNTYSKYNTKSPYAKSTFAHEVRSIDNKRYTQVNTSTPNTPKRRAKRCHSSRHIHDAFTRRLLRLVEKHAQCCPKLKGELALLKKEFLPLYHDLRRIQIINMSLELISRVKHLLVLTYSEPDDNARRYAEEQLEVFTQNINEILDALLTLVQDPDSNVQKSASVRLRDILQAVKLKGGVVGEARNAVIYRLFDIMIQANTENGIRQMLYSSLISLLAADASDPNGMSIQYISPVLLQGLSGEKAIVIGTLFSIRALICSLRRGSLLEWFINMFIEPLVLLTNKGIMQLRNFLGSPNEYLCFEAAEILEECAKTFWHLVEQVQIIQLKAMKKLILFENLAIVIREIISLDIPDPELAGLQCLLTLTRSDFCKMINRAKTHALLFLNACLQFSIDHSRRQLEESASEALFVQVTVAIAPSAFVTITHEILKPVIESLLMFNGIGRIQQLLQETDIKQLIVECLHLIEKCSFDPSFHRPISELYKPLLSGVGLNFVSLTAYDSMLIREQPEEFVYESCDACEKQEVRSVKAATAAMIDKICCYIDGPLTFIVNFALSVINLTLQNGDVQQIYVMQQFQGALENCTLLQQSEEIRLDACFLVISALYYNVVMRKDLVGRLDEMLLKNLDVFKGVTSPLVQNRLIMFLHYYCDDILSNNEKELWDYLDIMLRCSLPQVNPIAHIQACHTLNFICSDRKTILTVHPWLSQSIDDIIQSIPQQTEKAFFEAIVEIIDNNSDLVRVNYQKLISNCVECIQTNLLSNQRDMVKGNSLLIISKCWGIIRTVVKNEQFDQEQLLQIEDSVFILHECLNKLDRIDFQDDIIMIEHIVLTKCQFVTPIAWQLFPVLNNLIRKNKNTLQSIFTLLNDFIIYGARQLEGQPDKLQQICEICFFIFMSREDATEAHCSDAALVLQLMLQNIGTPMQQYIEPIVTSCLMFLLQSAYYNFLKIRILGVIYSALAYHTQLTLNILATHYTLPETDDLNISITTLQSLSPRITHPYDKKVFIQGIANMMMQPELPNQVSGRIVQIFECMIVIISNRPNVGAKPDSEKTSFDILVEKVLEEDDSDEEAENAAIDSMLDLSPDVQKEKEKQEEFMSNVTISNMNSHIKNLDEYQLFSNFMKQLQGSQNALQYLIQQLDDEMRGRLTETLKCRRVTFGGDEGGDVRRTVRVKRKV